MRIRRLTATDVVAYRALRLRALAEHPAAFGRSYADTLNESLESMAARLQSERAPDDFVLGAFDDALIGMVGFGHLQGEKLRHAGHIWGMYVVHEAAGRGVGRALLAQAVAEARLLPDLEQLTLGVTTTNTAALRLYQSLGFQTYGTELHALKLGRTYVDEYLMMLRWADPDVAPRS